MGTPSKHCSTGEAVADDVMLFTETTASPIVMAERQAVRLGKIDNPTERHTAAQHLKDELRAEYGDIIASVAVGDGWLSEYNPASITEKITAARVYFRNNPTADERQATETLQNPIAGIYAHFRLLDEWLAEDRTRAAVMYCYALLCAAVADREATTPTGTAEHTQQPPRWLQTDRAKAIFEAMAEAGYIEQQGDGYTWLDIEEQGKKKQCAYFCGKCVEELQDGHHGWNDLKRVFGVSFNVQQSYLKNKDNEQDKIEQWRQQINGIFARNAKP